MKFLVFLPLFAALLLAGCGEKSLSDADVEQLLKEAAEVGSLEWRDDLAYQNSEPYSGWVKEMYNSGQVQSLVRLKDGRPHGLIIEWYDGGQKAEEGAYKDGKPDGLWIEWHENGQKESKVNYKDGEMDGLATVWYENGQKKAEGIYKDDQLNGLATGWHENGEKWHEETHKEGKLISEKYWNSKGEEVATREESEK